MAKKTRPKKRTVSNAPGETAPSGKRGRQPNKWIEGFSPGNLVEYRKKHEISEAKLAAYLDTTLTSYRNWVGGQSTPSEAKQKELQDLLAKDYVAPPEGEKKQRGRPRKAAASARLATTTDAVVAPNGDGAHQTSSGAVAALALEYVRRLPAGQGLSIEDLEAKIARIRKALG